MKARLLVAALGALLVSCTGDVAHPPNEAVRSAPRAAALPSAVPFATPRSPAPERPVIDPSPPPPRACPERDEPAPGQRRVELWFSTTENWWWMRASVLHRDLPVTEAIGRATLEAWLKGPTPRERNLGFVGLVPDGAELLDLSIEDGLAVVDLSSEFEHAPLGSTGEGMLLAQLAGTITQFPRVDRGLLKIDGRFKDHYLGHGFLIDERHPLVKPPSESFYYACR